MSSAAPTGHLDPPGWQANELGLRFHHFGLAVRSPEAAFSYLRALGYRPGREVFDPLQKVNLAMRHHPEMPDVEVIWPGPEPSPIDNLIKRGSLIYHLCYTADDPQRAVERIEATGLGIMPVGPAKPAVLFDGLEVSFYSVESVGLIEIIRGEPAVAGEAATAT